MTQQTSRFWVLFSLLFGGLGFGLAACAAVASGDGGPNKTGDNTSKGPGIDLGSFVTPVGSLDLGVGVGDMSKASDMAMSKDMAMPKDLAMSPPDMAMSICSVIGYAGICQGNTLVYCDTGDTTPTTFDCTAVGLGCEVISGEADCYY